MSHETGRIHAKYSMYIHQPHYVNLSLVLVLNAIGVGNLHLPFWTDRDGSPVFLLQKKLIAFGLMYIYS